MTFECHPEMFLITPSIGITVAECDDAECDASHYALSFGWFIWSVHFHLS